MKQVHPLMQTPSMVVSFRAVCNAVSPHPDAPEGGVHPNDPYTPLKDGSSRTTKKIVRGLRACPMSGGTWSAGGVETPNSIGSANQNAGHGYRRNPESYLPAKIVSLPLGGAFGRPRNIRLVFRLHGFPDSPSLRLNAFS